MKKKIAIIGTGYVGLVAGTCFSETGNKVTCIDKNEKKINNLKKNIIPIYEPRLSEMINQNANRKLLFFSTDIKSAIEKNDIIFIAVGTPEDEDGSADISHVDLVAKEIANFSNGYKVIVNKSTVPVGTGDRIIKIISNISKHEFDIVSNPEFLKEGSAIRDFLKPDRVVLGSNSDKALNIMEELYLPYTINSNQIIKMDIKSAEITKYASNSILATKISFINEIANLCEKVGANINQVRKGMMSDIRIGSHFMYPGIGYGGSCFPKDVKAIIKTAKENQLEFSLLECVDKTNDNQKSILLKKIIKRFGENLSDKVFGIWGLAFKPETDDVREAPASIIIEKILERGGKIRVYDPEAMKISQKIWKNKIVYCEDLYDVIHSVHALVLCTEWMCFRQVDFSLIKQKMLYPIIFDGRNLWSEEIKNYKFDWYGIGMPEILNYSKFKNQ